MSSEITKVSGAILAGGKSTRMNLPKGMIQIDGKTLISSIASVLQAVVSDTMLIANDPVYDQCQFPVFKDIIPDKGPASGIHSALANTINEKVVIVSCDVPFVSGELFQYLLDRSAKKEIVVPVHSGKMEPLIGVYSKSIFKDLEKYLLKGEYKMHDLLKKLGAEFVQIPGDLFSEKLFTNINTPEDLRKAFPQYGSL